METATSAHERPLSIVISTQAPSDSDLLSILIDDAESGEDPRTVLALFTAPEDLDPFAKETIRLANPAFGGFQNAREVMGMAEAACRVRGPGGSPMGLRRGGVGNMHVLPQRLHGGVQSERHLPLGLRPDGAATWRDPPAL